jgi:hypothetical protein
MVTSRSAPTAPAQQRPQHAISLEQAVQQAPTLARLAELARDSARRLAAIEPLIPPALRPALQAGPIDGGTWCLLVGSSAAAAKLRQLLPALLAQLRSSGWEVETIRLKVLPRR